MSTSKAGSVRPLAVSVSFTRDQLVVELADGRTLATPLEWFPRLREATPDQRAKWELIGRGGGIHWADIDEDISIAGLVAGRPSIELLPKSKKPGRRAV